MNGEKQMERIHRFGIYVLICVLGCFAHANPATAQTTMAARATEPEQLRDGQHDFDFELGTWKIHLKRLLHPLTGSHKWVEFDGTSVTRKVWDGHAEIEQFETDGAAGGHVEGLTLRLYNPESHQWSLYWASSRSGTLGIPTVGEFRDGRGEFYDQEQINGRIILVRFVWSEISADSAHFEQSFSDDGGKTWEVNWITDQTRTSEQPDEARTRSSAPQTNSQTATTASAAEHDGHHDFDFHFGAWHTHIRRLVHPLTGSTTWVELDGTVKVRKIWDGRANLEELEAGSGTAHFKGLTLFLYNPESHQWSQNFANINDGALSSTPLMGEFKNGRGEFYDQELFNGRAILVRFVWSDISPNSHHVEQSFSDDGGKTWEANFVADLTRESE
jgi:hypothetical protein